MTQSQVSKSDNRAKELLGEALACHNAGNLGEAERCYLAVLEMEKDNAKALTFLGTLHVQRREYRKATKALRRSLRIDDRQPRALNSLGNALRELLRYEDAVVSYDRAIALRPDFSEAHFNKALALQMAGSLNDALASYDRAIVLKPDYVEALNNRANVLVKLQHYDRALEDFAHAIRLKPDSAQIHNNRGTALRALGRYSEALKSYNQAIALHSNYAEAHSNRGIALYSLGDHSEALASYDKAIVLGADNADVHFGKGDVLRAVKRYANAVESYDRAIELRADFAEAHLNKGLALEKDRRFVEALASYNKAIALKPDSALAHSNAGSVFGSLWRHDEALASFERAIALKPDFAEAYNNRALALQRLYRREESLADFDKAIAAKPDLVAAHYSRANLLRDVRRFEEALRGYDKAVALDPNCAEAHHDRAIALMEWGRIADAQAGYERALECDPELPYTLGFRWSMKLAVCDWNGLQQDRDALRTAVGRGLRACPPFPFMTVPCTPDLQRKSAEIYVNSGFRPQPPDALGPPLCRTRPEDRRIRLAYVSADLRNHAVGLLIAGIFEQHDSDKFDVYGISLSQDDGSKLRVRLKSAFEHFIDVTEKNDYEAAALLRNEQIDIAVDLTGFTKDSRPGIFAFHPAPIQVNYLGYPGTMGADYIDYIIADKIVIPEDEQSHYTEKVVYLPDTYQCNDSKRQAAQVPSRGAVGLPTEAFVFCSFNSTYKIIPEIFDIWMRLLHQKEGSVLWLLQSNATAAQNLRREAAVRGVAPERLIFATSVSNPEHLARHQLADLFLDTLPYGAHTTASDALWMGLPVLTCKGENFQGRVAASLLSAIGLPEMVTHSFAEYEAQALELASNPAALASVRAKLLRNRGTHALFDTVRFTRHLEAAYARMMERYRNGEPPISFAVEPI